MTEVNYILTTMTSRSLIIIDELCRSTSIEEGTAIAMAICEDLAKSGAYTYVTTHYTLLTKLADLFFNIKVWQMQTIPSGNPNNPKSMKLDYKYNLIPGTTTLKGYGIYMARNIWPEEALQHIDEFQRQLSKPTNDPEFPQIDKRARLKYDLECKLTKLKLQKKLTVDNFNKHVTEFNNKLAKFGGAYQETQCTIQHLLTPTEDGDSMDHSIFNASRNMSYGRPESEISKIYLNTIQEEQENNAFSGAVPSELSSIHPDQEEINNYDEVVLTPGSPYSSRSLKEIFLPDSNSFHSQSTHCSMNASQNFELLVPEVHLSYSPSQCSLNLTKNALEEGGSGQIQNDEKHLQVTNTQGTFYDHQNSNNDLSRNIFSESNIIRKPIVNYGASQVSSCDLSQQLQMIREQEGCLRIASDPPQSPPKMSPLLRSTEIDSSFISTFAHPLQSDRNKTSTPLITKIKQNARNFGSSSTSTRTPGTNGIQVTTPKINFTILNKIDNLDVQSVQEDLESFVDYMQNEDFQSEGDETSPKEQKNDVVSNGNATEDNDKEGTYQIKKDFNKIDFSKNIKKYKNLHIFPNVTVIEGPNNPSFEEESNSLVADTKEAGQSVSIPHSNYEKEDPDEDILIKAFNSLSEPKNPVLPKNIGNANNTNLQKSNNRENDYYRCNDNETNGFNIKDCDISPKDKASNMNPKNTEHIDLLIKAFNSLSNPRKVTDTNKSFSVKDKTTNDMTHMTHNESQVTNHRNDQSEDDLKSIENYDMNKNDTTSQVLNEDPIAIGAFIEGQNGRILIETEEDSGDRYESARSSPESIGYSPQNRSGNSKILTIGNSKNLSEESLFHIPEDCEGQLVTDHNQNIQHSKIPGDGRFEEVIELSDEEELVFEDNNVVEVRNIAVTDKGRYNDNSKTTSNDNDYLSDFYVPVTTQEANDSFVTDYEKSTERFPASGYNNPQQGGTETEEFIQKNTPEANSNVVSPERESKRTIKGKSKFYSHLSAESDTLSNYEDTTNPIVDVSLKSKAIDNSKDGLQTETRKNTINSKKNKSLQFIAASRHNLHADDQSNKIQSNLYNNLLVAADNLSDHIDTTTENNINFDLKSKETNNVSAEIFADNNTSSCISVAEVITTVDKDALTKDTFKVAECRKEIGETKSQIKSETKKRNKEEETNSSKTEKSATDEESRIKPAQHIPYLSAYSISSSSEDSERSAKTQSTDYFTADLSSDATITNSKSGYRRTPTLGMARCKPISKKFKPKKVPRRNDETRSTNKQNIKSEKHPIDKNPDIITDNNLLDKDVSKFIGEENEESKEIPSIADTGSVKSATAKLPGHPSRYRGIKRRRLSQSQAGSTSVSGHGVRNKIMKKRTVTSISEASKLRNLDGDVSSNLSGVTKYCEENALEDPREYYGNSNDDHTEHFAEKTVTSVSDASRKRNLDQSTNSSSDKKQSQNNSQHPGNQIFASLGSSGEASDNIPKKTKKFRKPSVTRRKSNSFINETSSSSKTDATSTQGQLKGAFISPSKLSKKAIQEAFYEQDKHFFGTSGSSTELAKIWEQRLKRPSIRQLQRSTCLATLRKTEEGVEVIPKTEKKKRKYSKLKGQFLSSSSSSVNMNIFSDKNAKTFDQFIKSDRKDFKSFNFNFGYGEGSSSRNNGNMFNFSSEVHRQPSINRNAENMFNFNTQVNVAPSGYIQNGQRLEEFTSMTQQSDLPFLSQNAGFSSTPEGFYKRNKDDINQLLKKYN